jgi:hypothetical protein
MSGNYFHFETMSIKGRMQGKGYRLPMVNALSGPKRCEGVNNIVTLALEMRRSHERFID